MVKITLNGEDLGEATGVQFSYDPNSKEFLKAKLLDNDLRFVRAISLKGKIDPYTGRVKFTEILEVIEDAPHD